jgi:hypothetical protein
MSTRKITDDAAFDILRTASQRGRRKLRDIAEDIITTGTLDAPPHNPTGHHPTRGRTADRTVAPPRGPPVRNLCECHG